MDIIVSEVNQVKEIVVKSTTEEALAKAVQAAQDAETAETNAANSASAASTSETNASNSANAASGSADLAEAWAESPTEPDGAGTKSAKTWAGEAEQSAAEALAITQSLLNGTNLFYAYTIIRDLFNTAGFSELDTTCSYNLTKAMYE